MNRVPELNWTVAQCAYLAALIDGEGCIGIVRSFKEGQVRYCTSLTIGNTSPVVADIQREYGLGNVVWHKQKHQGWKPKLEWRIGAYAIRAVLPLVLPYMRIKRNQAELALRFLALPKYNQAEAKKRAWEEMRELNRKGTR